MTTTTSVPSRIVRAARRFARTTLAMSAAIIGSAAVLSTAAHSAGYPVIDLAAIARVAESIVSMGNMTMQMTNMVKAVGSLESAIGSAGGTGANWNTMTVPLTLTALDPDFTGLVDPVNGAPLKGPTSLDDPEAVRNWITSHLYLGDDHLENIQGERLQQLRHAVRQRAQDTSLALSYHVRARVDEYARLSTTLVTAGEQAGNLRQDLAVNTAAAIATLDQTIIALAIAATSAELTATSEFASAMEARRK